MYSAFVQNAIMAVEFDRQVFSRKKCVFPHHSLLCCKQSHKVLFIYLHMYIVLSFKSWVFQVSGNPNPKSRVGCWNVDCDAVCAWSFVECDLFPSVPAAVHQCLPWSSRCRKTSLLNEHQQHTHAEKYTYIDTCSTGSSYHIASIPAMIAVASYKGSGRAWSWFRLCYSSHCGCWCSRNGCAVFWLLSDRCGIYSCMSCLIWHIFNHRGYIDIHLLLLDFNSRALFFAVSYQHVGTTVCFVW